MYISLCVALKRLELVFVSVPGSLGTLALPKTKKEVASPDRQGTHGTRILKASGRRAPQCAVSRHGLETQALKP